MSSHYHFVMNKLVRDKVSQPMRDHQVVVHDRVMEDAEYKLSLKDKLLEEAQEVIEAVDREALTEELADVLEVIHALGAVHAISYEVIESARQAKKAAKGGFEGRCYLSSIEVENHQQDVLGYCKKPASAFVMEEAADIMIRHPTLSDIAAMVRLSYAKRKVCEAAQPQFWRHAGNAEAIQAEWFETLMQAEDYITYVATRGGELRGFGIGRLVKAPEVYDPGGLTLLIDDFCVTSPTDWVSVGYSLVQALKNSARMRGAAQLLVVCGAHDAHKRHFLHGMGLSIASEWFVASI